MIYVNSLTMNVTPTDPTAFLGVWKKEQRTEAKLKRKQRAGKGGGTKRKREEKHNNMKKKKSDVD